MTNLLLFRSNIDRILQFTLQRLTVKPVEWRRILKTLNCIDFSIKNGSPQIVMAYKQELYKISVLCNFGFTENGKD